MWRSMICAQSIPLFCINCWNKPVVFSPAGIKYPICLTIIFVTSSTITNPRFCSTYEFRMVWNISAVASYSGCSLLWMFFWISRRIAGNTLLIVSIFVLNVLICWTFKSGKSCFASVRGSDGRIYLYYPICEVVELLHCEWQKPSILPCEAGHKKGERHIVFCVSEQPHKNFRTICCMGPLNDLIVGIVRHTTAKSAST